MAAKGIIFVDLEEAEDMVADLTKGGVRVPKSVCPHCGAPFGGASSSKHDYSEPKPGDLGICIACAGWTQFDDKLMRVLPDKKAARFVKRDPDCRRAERKVREMLESIRHAAKQAIFEAKL